MSKRFIACLCATAIVICVSIWYGEEQKLDKPFILDVTEHILFEDYEKNQLDISYLMNRGDAVVLQFFVVGGRNFYHLGDGFI
ncbi:hypothetical protein [Solibacillus sp. FSL H8-0538]|uniref:hypothetical protein n=1 Tax=Solibacillus sp. FSL H8-0538 TaxID=2921400 RepID=UPI0030FC20E2